VDCWRGKGSWRSGRGAHFGISGTLINGTRQSAYYQRLTNGSVMVGIPSCEIETTPYPETESLSPRSSLPSSTKLSTLLPSALTQPDQQFCTTAKMQNIRQQVFPSGHPREY